MLSPIASSQEDACAFCALVDIAVESADGLASPGITETETIDLDMARRILRRIVVKLSVQEVVERIGRSAYPAALLAYTPHIYGLRVRDRRRVARAVYAMRHHFDSETVTAFADEYWTLAFMERLVADDIAGANNMITLATLGPLALYLKVGYVLKPFTEYEPVGLLVSVECGRRLVYDLHTRLVYHRELPDMLKEPQPESVEWNTHWPAGIKVAEALGGYNPDGDGRFSSIGLQALAVARYACSQTAKAVEDVSESPVSEYQ